MSRRKGQTVKGLSGKRAAEKLRIAQYGADIEAQVIEVVGFWEALFHLDSKLGILPPDYLENFGMRYWFSEAGCSGAVPIDARVQTDLLVGKLRQALETGDASFFRQLADTLERFNQSQIDQLRAWLTTKFFLQLANQDGGAVAKGWENTFIEVQPWTAAELVEKIQQDGLRVDERQVRRMCAELGIKLAEGKRGRPKKSPL